MTLAALRWEPLTRTPRRLLVSCALCHVREPNVSGRLRGWEQAAGYRDTYRCAACSAERAER
jgi:hypothetical protein